MKANSDLAVVLKCLPKLTPGDLQKVRLRVGFLLGASDKPSASHKKESQDWLLDGITNELRRRGVWARNCVIPKTLLPEGYGQKSETIRAHLLAGVSSANLRPVERMSLGVLGATALADYLTKVGVPVSAKTMLSNLDKLPFALEGSFPGYWKNKLLGFCLNL